MTDDKKRWRWCAACGGIREPYHQHGDELESLNYEQLLERARIYRAQRYAGPIAARLHKDKPNGVP